jgi:hypothetical protein
MIYIYFYLFFNNKKAYNKYINNRKYKLSLLLKLLKIIIVTNIIKKGINNVKKNINNKKKNINALKKKTNIKKNINIIKKVINIMIIKVFNKYINIFNNKKDNK